ncbi:MAG: Ig-like domain-containing protein [Thermoplasmata archaeon]
MASSVITLQQKSILKLICLITVSLLLSTLSYWVLLSPFDNGASRTSERKESRTELSSKALYSYSVPFIITNTGSSDDFVNVYFKSKGSNAITYSFYVRGGETQRWDNSGDNPSLIINFNTFTFGNPPYYVTVTYYTKDGKSHTGPSFYCNADGTASPMPITITFGDGGGGQGGGGLAVSITNPQNGDTVDGTVQLSGTSSGLRVYIALDGVWKGYVNVVGGAWSIPFDTTTKPDGTCTITVKSSNDGYTFSPEKSITINVKNTQTPVENTPPTVYIDAPPSNSVVRNITFVSVSATDPDGDNIEYIRIYINNTLVVNVTSPSHSYPWNTKGFPDGQYVIKADASDGKSTSDPVSITVTVDNGQQAIGPAVNKPPTIIISSPNNMTNVSGIITINGSASDSDGFVKNVTIKIGSGGWQSVSDLSPFDDWSSWALSLDTSLISNGNLTIYAKAIDNNDSATITEAVFTISNNHQPTISITSPFNGSSVNGTISISGTAVDVDGDNLTIEIQIDNGSWTPIRTSGRGIGDWGYEWNTTTATDDNHSVSARCSDGYLVSEVKTISLKIKNQQPPLCSILSPATNDIISGQVVVSGSAFDIDGDNLTINFGFGSQAGTFWFDVADVAKISENLYAWNFTLDTTNQPDGRYWLLAKANDGYADSYNISRIYIRIKNTKPLCNIKEPAEGTVFKNETMNEGIARVVVGYSISSAMMNSSVEIRIDDGEWNREGLSASNTTYYDWDTTNYSNGIHRIYARAYDGLDYSLVDMVNVTLRSYQPPQNITILQDLTRQSIIVKSITFSKGTSTDRFESINISVNESVNIVVNVTNNRSFDTNAVIILYADDPDKDKDGAIDNTASVIFSKTKTITAKGGDSFETSWYTAEIGEHRVYAMLIEGLRNSGGLYPSKGVIRILQPLANIEIDIKSVRILRDVKDGQNTTNISVGDTVYIKAAVKNSGLGDVRNDTLVNFYDGTILIENKLIPPLNSTEQKEIFIEWTPETSGAHTIKIVVDPGNKINESDKSDNSFTFSVKVTDKSQEIGPFLLAIAIIAGVTLVAVPLIILSLKRREEKKLL